MVLQQAIQGFKHDRGAYCKSCEAPPYETGELVPVLSYRQLHHDASLISVEKQSSNIPVGIGWCLHYFL